MRVDRAILAGFYPPPFAGEPVHVKQLAQLLRDHGLVVEILNLNRHARPSIEYRSSTRRGTLLWKLFALADGASILHLHTNGHNRKSWLLILIASLAGRIRGTKTVLTLHSGLLPAYVAGFGRIAQGVARWILGSFARIVCVNGEIRRAIERLGITGDYIAVIPAFLGVPQSVELAPPDREIVRDFRPLLVAVAGGEEDPERGLAVVLRAVQQLVALIPDLGVVLMGWEVGPKTRPLIDQLGLAGRAVCLGEVAHDRCLAFIRAGDVIVRSTFVDGDAITVREALAFGVPVVASDTDFRPESVTRFRKGDVADLVAKLRQVLGAPGAGRSAPLASHDQPARDLWQLYSELASPGTDASPLLQPPRRRGEIPMKLQRVVRMDLAEISCRARHEVSKWIDRRAEPRRSVFKAGISAELIEQCLQEMPNRFFAGANDPCVPAILRDRFPDSGPRIIKAADRTLQKRFDLLGYRQLSFGDPIDWHLDAVSRRRTPLLHWTLLDPLAATTVGDSKVVWELNRHQWLVRLGQAYRLTGDERYADMFADTIRAWKHANPQGMGINWASSLEAAFRLISWCWALSLFRGSAAVTPQLRADLVEGIAGHASRIERYLSYYFSPNTHLTGEALGLLYVGVLFPLLPAASRWRQEATQILIREADRQILPDGVYMEQSTCYQCYTAEIYLHFIVLASRNGMSVPDGVVRRLESLLDALIALRRPNGSLPQIGDADGGRLLPLEPRLSGDASGVFSIAATALKRGDYGWAAGGLMPDVLWLLGAEGVQVFDCLESTLPAQTPSRLFPHGGYAVMRTGWHHESDHVILDGGSLGCRVSGGHGHADLLSVEASFRGQSYIVDPGTFRYTADEGWRSYYRGTAAHSTVEIDEVGQAVPRGPFGWVSRPRAQIIRWTSTPDLDAATAEHHAYGRLQDPVVHRRSVFLVKRRHCVIVDDLAGAAEHRVRLRFQFAPMSVTLDRSGWVRAGRGKQKGLLLHAFSTSALKAAILEGETDPRQGWVASDYGDHQPAPMLVYSVTAPLPVRIVTLLFPTDTLLAPPPSVSPVTRGGWLRGLAFDDVLEPIWMDTLRDHPSRP